MKLMQMHHSNVLEHRKQLLEDIKKGKSVNRKELQDKYEYWIKEQKIWIERDKQQSTINTTTRIFECGCNHCTYRMALELLDKLEAENQSIKIVQEQDEVGQYKFEF